MLTADQANHLQYAIREIINRHGANAPWWEITDMIQSNYFIEKKPVGNEDRPEDHTLREITPSMAQEDIMSKFDGVIRNLNGWVYGGETGEER